MFVYFPLSHLPSQGDMCIHPQASSLSVLSEPVDGRLAILYLTTNVHLSQFLPHLSLWSWLTLSGLQIYSVLIPSIPPENFMMSFFDRTSLHACEDVDQGKLHSLLVGVQTCRGCGNLHGGSPENWESICLKTQPNNSWAYTYRTFHPIANDTSSGCSI